MSTKITLEELSPELKEKYEVRAKLAPCEFPGCSHKTKRGLCYYHNPESKEKQRAYCRKYLASERGKEKNREANNRLHAKQRDIRNLFEQLPLEISL